MRGCLQVLQCVHQCAAQLGDAGESAEMALQLFLTAAYSASEHAKSELIAYEFFEQVTVLEALITTLISATSPFHRAVAAAM